MGFVQAAEALESERLEMIGQKGRSKKSLRFSNDLCENQYVLLRISYGPGCYTRSQLSYIYLNLQIEKREHLVRYTARNHDFHPKSPWHDGSWMVAISNEALSFGSIALG